MTKLSDEYGTPLELYKFLDARFRFRLDPCTTKKNPLNAPVFFTKKENGLLQNWDGPVFMNPPYSQIEPWAKKASDEANKGSLVVGLIRNDRSTRWWQKWINGSALVIDIPYRISFRDPQRNMTDYRAYNFPSALVVWWGAQSLKRRGSETGELF